MVHTSLSRDENVFVALEGNEDKQFHWAMTIWMQDVHKEKQETGNWGYSVILN